MDHLRSSYRPRHRRADKVASRPWRAAGGREREGAGFSVRSVLVLIALAVVAVGSWIPWYLGRAGADTLATATGSAASVESATRVPVDAASTPATPASEAAAIRSRRARTVPGSSAAAPSPSRATPSNPTASTPPPKTTTQLAPAVPGPSSQTARAVALVNTARAGAGCGPVRSDPRLAAASLAHSQDMIARDYFSHTTPDGVSPWDRAKAAGYEMPTGENIALGQPDAAAVTAAWMNSEGHRENILNCASKAIGMGLATDSAGTPYWTQMFGAK